MNLVKSASDTLICVVPKCGSQSMMMALTKTDHNFVRKEDSENYARRVAFIRDPFERLSSMFSHAYAISAVHAKGVDFLPEGVITGLNAEEDYKRFIDHILTNEDTHWTPQAEQLEGIANIYHPFEELPARWFDYVDGMLPWINKWKKIPHAEYRLDDLTAYYDRDIALRSKL